MSIIATRIKEQRNICELTQSELAKKIKSSRGAIAKYEGGEREPSFAVLSLLAEALDTTVSYLTGETDNPFKDRQTAKNEVRDVIIDGLTSVYKPESKYEEKKDDPVYWANTHGNIFLGYDQFSAEILDQELDKLNTFVTALNNVEPNKRTLFDVITNSKNNSSQDLSLIHFAFQIGLHYGKILQQLQEKSDQNVSHLRGSSLPIQKDNVFNDIYKHTNKRNAPSDQNDNEQKPPTTSK